jgi:hypothetical protein
MITYELHTQKPNEKWQLQTVFDDRETALHEARLIDETDRYSNLQVVEEHYDDASNNTSQSIIFRGGTHKKAALSKTADSAEAREKRRKQPPTEREYTRTVQPAKAAAASKTMSPVLILFLALMVGLVGLYAMYEFTPD